MTIGLFSAETEKVRNYFRILKNLQQEIIQQNIPDMDMKELSMGMSSDLETEIEEGFTIIGSEPQFSGQGCIRIFIIGMKKSYN